MRKLWSSAHSIALGFLFGVSLMTAAIWYGVPSKAQSITSIPVGNSWHFGPSSGLTTAGLPYAGYGGSFWQDLGVSPATIQAPSPGWNYGTEGAYTLSFSVVNWFPNYPGYYRMEIDFGSQEFCQAKGWATSRQKQVTVTCPASNYIVFAKALPGGGPVQGSQNFVLHFTVDDGSANGGWPVILDNKVSFSFTSFGSE